ncbi:glycosyltransferase family 2 protein [Tenacibaculum sp. 190524A02b]|uniref:Teichuronic acid biosynthesis glycosyltransferase TuaG n=1 Tax=Tenacibaculum vairaonense TaxID=3137860 RepID=A0ABP1F8A9_9FLAO
METNPKVSVLIPHYNGAEYIEETIKSVINQTYSDFIELIVVDDCSPNKESLKFLKFLKTKYEFTLLEHEENSGAARAFHTGAKHASGDLIAFLGQDDLFKLDKIEKQVNYLEKNSLCVACYSGFELYEERLETYSPFITTETINAIKEKTIFPSLYIKNNFCFTLQGLLVKKEIVSQFFLPIWNKLLLDDWPIHIKLFNEKNEQIGFLDEVLFTYRVHDSNLSKQKIRTFAMVSDVIANMCPQKYQEEAMKYHIKHLGLNQKEKKFKNFFKWK